MSASNNGSQNGFVGFMFALATTIVAVCALLLLIAILLSKVSRLAHAEETAPMNMGGSEVGVVGEAVTPDATIFALYALGLKSAQSANEALSKNHVVEFCEEAVKALDFSSAVAAIQPHAVAYKHDLPGAVFEDSLYDAYLQKCNN